MPGAWKPLKIGDSVAVVNPCLNDRDGAAHVVQYRELLEGKWGYRVNGLQELESEKGSRLWSGTPEERAEKVIAAIRNPDNKAIFLLVGGDGANETMKLVADWHQREISEGKEGLPKRGIPVIGLSNNTTLLNPLAQMGIISPVQGKLDAAVAREENAEALHNLLSGKTPTLEFQITPINAAAKNYAGETQPVEIVGGCNFHVIESARTPFQLATKGKYLAVEGPEEQCSATETLAGLQREGMLEGVKGVFFGYIKGYDQQAKQDEIRAAAEKINVPIYVGMPWGHIPLGTRRDVYLPLNTNASFALKDDIPTLTVAAVRTQENLDQAAKTNSAFSKKTREVEGDSVITSMESMLQDLEPINLSGKDVTLAFTPKFGEPVSHLMGVSQSLSALLHKGSLEGIKSLTLDLSGLYDDKDKPLYRRLSGEAITPPPPHKYNGAPITTAIPSAEIYEKEISAYLQDFSNLHLGGVPTQAGQNKITEKISKETQIPITDLQTLYQKRDGTGRLDASAMATDFNSGKMQDRARNTEPASQKSWVEKMQSRAPSSNREL